MFSRKNPPPGFYVYVYFRKNGTPYYCGKGHSTRAWDKHRKNNKGIQLPSDLHRIVIVAYDLREVGSFILERKLIQWYGRKDTEYTDRPPGILYNRTDGGDGCSGYKHTEKFIKLIKQRQTGSGNSFYGKKHTSIRNKKFGQIMKGKQAGDKNSRYDNTAYFWNNKFNNTIECLTQHELHIKYDISKIMVNHIIKGRSTQAKGISLANIVDFLTVNN
jgi:hypothetical protein